MSYCGPIEYAYRLAVTELGRANDDGGLQLTFNYLVSHAIIYERP